MRKNPNIALLGEGSLKEYGKTKEELNAILRENRKAFLEFDTGGTGLGKKGERPSPTVKV